MNALELPHALTDRATLDRKLDQHELQIFLDYDGTLTPIVARPEQADLDPRTRHTVQLLAQRYPVAIISGRELSDVKARVGLPQLFYAGNHGFQIAGPEGSGFAWQIDDEYRQKLDSLDQALNQCLPSHDGLIIEHKQFSLSIHYRLIDDSDVPELERILSNVLVDYPELHLRFGKKVFEVRPDVDWHKGKAMRRLIETFNKQSHDKSLPVFVGDDLTDEDAFEELRGHGLGILVGSGDRQTAAHFRLDDSTQVRQLLAHLNSRP